MCYNRRDKMKSVRLLIPLALIIAALFTVTVGFPTENEKPAIVRYADEQWVYDDGTTFRLRSIPDPDFSFEFEVPDFLLMPYEKYFKLLEEGKLTIEAEKYVCYDPNTGWVIETYALIEPKIIRVDIPISGSLAPGTGHRYPPPPNPPYSSCVAIAVSVTWTPGEQWLGIAIADADTGEAYGYWYTGGSASRTFSTDWMGRYYILILSHPGNTKSITYSGTITLYMW
jgi:hypothetical protein